jgi:pimeloyl-ACP methyl ester carboxylesterase
MPLPSPQVSWTVARGIRLQDIVLDGERQASGTPPLTRAARAGELPENSIFVIPVTRPIIQFSHANGFPAPCYSKLFGFLESDFRIGYLDRIGHDARFPVGDGWDRLVDELIDRIEAQWNEPVIGVGHSLGGYLSALAAVRRPELFRAIILLDAPILGQFTGSAVQFIKHIGLIDRVTPAGSVKHRRRDWPSREDAIAYFRAKALFRNFDPDCLRDYVRFGTVDDGNRVKLWFDPVLEYQIYRTIPHDIAGSLKRLTVAGGFVGGSESAVLKRVGLGHTRRRFRLALVSGGHLFPFELPQNAALAVRRMAADLGAL